MIIWQVRFLFYRDSIGSLKMSFLHSIQFLLLSESHLVVFFVFLLSNWSCFLLLNHKTFRFQLHRNALAVTGRDREVLLSFVGLVLWLELFSCTANVEDVYQTTLNIDLWRKETSSPCFVFHCHSIIFIRNVEEKLSGG